eukprot:TRINITY_DN906_c1_g2_i2.p1 TRINITY_DN906_c1_g2~~TRINITY_DN906_c1_g2_i2.p1  ORF type:complete len:397 (+),score=25.76 TRINITY_DN906_c1_g2_i2:137-1327(+)
MPLHKRKMSAAHGREEGNVSDSADNEQHHAALASSGTSGASSAACSASALCAKSAPPTPDNQKSPSSWSPLPPPSPSPNVPRLRFSEPLPRSLHPLTKRRRTSAPLPAVAVDSATASPPAATDVRAAPHPAVAADSAPATSSSTNFSRKWADKYAHPAEKAAVAATATAAAAATGATTAAATAAATAAEEETLSARIKRCSVPRVVSRSVYKAVLRIPAGGIPYEEATKGMPDYMWTPAAREHVRLYKMWFLMNKETHLERRTDESFIKNIAASCRQDSAGLALDLVTYGFPLTLETFKEFIFFICDPEYGNVGHYTAKQFCSSVTQWVRRMLLRAQGKRPQFQGGTRPLRSNHVEAAARDVRGSSSERNRGRTTGTSTSTGTGSRIGPVRDAQIL